MDGKGDRDQGSGSAHSREQQQQQDSRFGAKAKAKVGERSKAVAAAAYNMDKPDKALEWINAALTDWMTLDSLDFLVERDSRGWAREHLKKRLRQINCPTDIMNELVG